MAAAKATPRAKAKPSVTVVLDTPQAKKQVVRYDNKQDGAALASVYVNKSALEKLGNPASIKITIEAA